MTNHLPKALVPFRGRPLLHWIIQNLVKNGVKEIIINTHYLADQIEIFLQENSYGIPVSTSFEAEILGTGGGLYQTKSFWGKEPFLVCNADILCQIKLVEFVSHFTKRMATICLAINHVESESMLLVDKNGILCGREKGGKREVYRSPEGVLSKVGFSGFHLLTSAFFELRISSLEFSIIDQYFQLIQSGVLIDTWDIGNIFWQDIGTPQALKSAEINYPKG